MPVGVSNIADLLFLFSSSSSSNQSDRLSYGEGDHRHPDSSVLSNSRYEDVRRATPEKFQPEGYGLEEDGLVVHTYT